MQLPPATDEEAEEVEAQFGDPGGEDITVEQVAEVADDDDDTETAASAVCASTCSCLLLYRLYGLLHPYSVPLRGVYTCYQGR